MAAGRDRDVVVLCVIAYDVVDNRRREKAARLLLGYGRRVQYSVFECHLSPEEMTEVWKELQSVLDCSVDRCHLYRLCPTCETRGEVLGLELEASWGEALVL